MLSQNQYSLAQKPGIAEIVKEFGSRLKGFIRKRARTTEDTEDILQDVYYQLAEADQLMKPIDQILAWMYTVARNRIIDFYRKKRPELIEEYYNEEEESVLSEIGELMVISDNSPDTEYLKSLVWIELEKALNELPVEQRAAFVMNEMEGLSFKEIAAITGEPENTLLSRKRYAVLHLRKRLRELYDELINF